ncbi:NAD(P)-dependent oxidoreductase [Streptomyces sp. TRM66268-LWL]|uniref:NAD(P)-dependent oxidoreductase n=1 Tax=Streptomyces polyasparticus TaxID=2767826 RepID=A0ABR7SN26_9ACTN|nr:NAD(P)-binding domain-containing protein [Streptomyces polyasparticus]MBC9716095.1 NAD(P)-dependent oxidoreductase [Streptomyces polyasparticus]
MTSSTAVSVIGLGDMGKALAASLLSAGFRTTVWNRTAEKADELVAKGALRAATAEEALVASPLTIVCLIDYDTTRTLLAQAAGALRGRTLVQLSNGTPAQARELETWAREQGAAYLDGGIMAVPSTIATPEAFLLYSGDSEAFAAQKEILEVMGEAKYLGAEVGLASLYDLALLSGMDYMFAGFFHSVAVATSHKESTAAGFTELLVPWLTNMARLLPVLAADVDSDGEPAYAQGLDVVLAAARNMAQAARDAGVRADHFERSAEDLESQLAAGGRDFTASGAVERLRAG